MFVVHEVCIRSRGSKKESTASSTDDSATDHPIKDSSSADTTEESETDRNAAETKENTSSLGKRSNPIPFGEAYSFFTTYTDDDYNEIPATISMTISHTIRGEEAFQQLLMLDEYNNPAPEGKEWLVFDATLTVEEGSQDSPYELSLSEFTPISSSGEELHQEEYVSLPDEKDFSRGELYEGGTKNGKVALLVPVGEQPLVKYTDFTTTLFFEVIGGEQV